VLSSLRASVISGCFALLRPRIPKNQIKIIHHENTKTGNHEKTMGIYQTFFFSSLRAFVIRGCFTLYYLRSSNNQVKIVHHESTKFGKLEKDPILL